MLRWCSKSAPGSQIIFTYVHQDVIENPGAFFGTARLLARLEAAGERWTFGLDPACWQRISGDGAYRLLKTWPRRSTTAPPRRRCVDTNSTESRGLL
jgi:hypothetical protein